MTDSSGWHCALASMAVMDELLQFCVVHEIEESGVDASRALGRLISNPEQILDLWCGDDRVAVGALLDRVDVAGAMPFELLGASIRPLPGAAIVKLWDWLCLHRPAQEIIIDLSPVLEALRKPLQDGEFTQSHSSYQMHRPRGMTIPFDGPAKNFHWVDYSETYGDALYDLAKAAFGLDSGAGIPQKDDFLTTLRQKKIPPLLLLCEGRIAGYTTLSQDEKDSSLGHINLLARHPDFRGQGIGACLLGAAIQRLKREGCDQFSLEVSSRNPHALTLYRQFGFTPQRAVDVYRGRINLTNS